MYAVYKPSSTSTRTAGVVRDLARLITEESVDNLQFHDSNSTSIINSSVAGGWSLADPSSLSTDATPGVNDKLYILENNSKIGSNKKYAAIRCGGQYTSSTSYNSTIGQQYGIMMNGVLDYGAANELMATGRSDTNGGELEHDTISYRAHGYPTTFHIFTSPEFLGIVGSRYDGRMVAFFLSEFADNELTKYYRNTYSSSVPVAWWTWSTFWESGTTQSQFYSAYYGDNENGSEGKCYSQYLQCLGNPHTSEYYRTFNIGYRWTNEFDNDQHKVWHGQVENSSTTGAASTTYNNVYWTNAKAEAAWDESNDRRSFNQYYRVSFTDSSWRRYKKDENGNNILPLYPILQAFDPMNSGTTINLSQYSGVYQTRLDLGASTGDTITIGNDVYVYFHGQDYLGSNATSNAFLWFLVKVT